MELAPDQFSVFFKIATILTIVSNILVIVNAILSAREMGGTLGQGLKKIAAGTIIHIILFGTYMLLEQGNRGILSDEQIRLFFMVTGFLGSLLLVLGFTQVYKITKKLKLFTP